MIILAIDTSANPGSVALVNENGKIIGEYFINTTLTHSETLMVMVDSLLKTTKTDIKEIDLFAVSTGPGSFTGIRIAVAAVKGMAMGLNKPCVSVSTLDSMAENLILSNGIVCAVMDARCNQVYNSIYKIKDRKIEKLCEDRAIKIEDLTKELKKQNEKIILVGDGALLSYNLMKDTIKNIELAPENLLYQRGSSVAIQGIKEYNNKKTVSAESLMPKYLRMPQAQRELKKKQQGS